MTDNGSLTPTSAADSSETGPPAFASQAMELAALQESAQALTSTLHLPAVLEIIADRACTFIGAEHCTVFELDPVDGCLYRRAVRGRLGNEAEPAISLGHGVAGAAALRRRVVFSPDVELEPPPKYDEPWAGLGMTMAEIVRRRGIRAILGVPLVSRETVLGAVCLYWDQPHGYDEREVRRLTNLAQYAAIAIENARLYADMAEQRREAELLAEITRDLSSSLDLASVLRKIIAHARERCTSDMAFVAPYDRQRRVATIVASVGARTDIYTGVNILPGSGIGGKVLETGQPFVTGDYLNDPRFSHDYDVRAEQEGFVANMAVPILSVGGEILGLLWVVNRSPRPFTARHQAVLTTLASHAAIAVRNARLFEATQRRLDETAALLRIAEILNSKLELEPVLKEIAQRTSQVLGFDRCSVFLWNGGPAQPVMSQFADGRAASGPWQAFREMTRHQVEEIPALGEAIRSAAPVVVPDARISSLIPDWWGETFSLRSVLIVPLIRQSVVIGVLLLDRADPAPLGEPQLALATTIAAQVALAVETARHHAEERSRAVTLAAQVELTQASTSTLELKPRLKAIAQHTARAMGVERCTIDLLRDGRLVPVMSQHADGHHDPALWAKFKRLLGRPMQDNTASVQAMRLKRPVLVEDARRSDLLARDWVEMFGLRAVLIVPLIAKDEVVGIMSFTDSQPRSWTASQVDLAMTLAAQVALSVENARLYEESQRARADLESKNAELDTFVYSVSHDLKAPLVTIQGMAGLLLDECGPGLPEEASRYLGRIQANTQQMESLITDLLALSRIGHEGRAPAAVSLEEIVEDVAADLAPVLRDHGIELVSGELPVLWGIRTQIEQVMRNLIGNAVKYLGDTAAGRVEVAAADRGAFVECQVRDNGIGIDPAYHERIFEVFQRLKEVEAEGTGVGLTIAMKIIQTNGGRIWVESEKGRGATFRFTWPKRTAGGEG